MRKRATSAVTLTPPLRSSATQCGNALNTMVEPEAQEEDPLMGKELLGRYTIQRLLGVGGMGKVYVADQRLGEATREVAIKTLLPNTVATKTFSSAFVASHPP